VDAAHFVLASFLGWMWCAARRFVKAAAGRQRYNVLGALNAVTHEVIRVSSTTYINADTVCQLLWRIAGLGLGMSITLVLDNARYQHCRPVQDLATVLHIELLFLPWYPPPWRQDQPSGCWRDSARAAAAIGAMLWVVSMSIWLASDCGRTGQMSKIGGVAPRHCRCHLLLLLLSGKASYFVSCRYTWQ